MEDIRCLFETTEGEIGKGIHGGMLVPIIDNQKEKVNRETYMELLQIPAANFVTNIVQFIEEQKPPETVLPAKQQEINEW